MADALSVSGRAQELQCRVTDSKETRNLARVARTWDWTAKGVGTTLTTGPWAIDSKGTGKKHVDGRIKSTDKLNGRLAGVAVEVVQDDGRVR